MKGMNLSARSNILGIIVNALEMILNNPRAVNFICQCFQGKNWSIPYLAVCGLMVIPKLIWGRCTYMIFIKFSQNVYMGISFEKMRKNWGSPCWLGVISKVRTSRTNEGIFIWEGGGLDLIRCAIDSIKKKKKTESATVDQSHCGACR